MSLDRIKNAGYNKKRSVTKILAAYEDANRSLPLTGCVPQKGEKLIAKERMFLWFL